VVTVVADSSAVAEGFATAATMATGTQLAAWAQDHELVIIATDEDGVSRVFEGQDETAHRAD
jgi:thiamine biosynthesis lipoprotein ApbE